MTEAAQSILPASPHMSREEIYSRICVRDPYFALEEVMQVGEGTVTARVPVQQVLGGEVGPIGAAEAGRHLAILGCCAGSLVNPREGRHYYLAADAVLRRTSFSGGERGGTLMGRAKAEFTGKRTCVARAELLQADGSGLYSLEVSYNVLPASVFHKLFEGARVEMRRAPRPPGGGGEGRSAEVIALRRNPYSREIPFQDVECDGDSIRATLERVDAELCKGHFAMHPVLPVAIVMYGLSDIAGRLLSERMGAPGLRYFVRCGTVHAENMALAGETITFQARHVGEAGTDHELVCRAVSGSKLIGEMKLTLTPVR